jgi:hypothetical protein
MPRLLRRGRIYNPRGKYIVSAVIVADGFDAKIGYVLDEEEAIYLSNVLYEFISGKIKLDDIKVKEAFQKYNWPTVGPFNVYYPPIDFNITYIGERGAIYKVTYVND